MKKIAIIISALLLVLSLNGCAKKGAKPPVTDDPFSGGSVSDIQAPPDDYEELFGKYQTGDIKIGGYSVQGGSVLEYTGGSIDISFDMDTTGNQYEVEEGFLAFLNGIPQTLSLNGGESRELVKVSQQPDKSERMTLSFTPKITEEYSKEEILRLQLVSIFNPSYKPSGGYTGFGNAHSGQSFLELDIKASSQLEILESELKAAEIECESVLITDEVSEKYGIKKPDEDSPTAISVKDAQTKEQLLTLRGNETDAEILLYGSETYKYRVYVYVNHKRINLGGDFIGVEQKSNCLNIIRPRLDLKEGDIVYAIAVPENAETGKMAVRKSASVLTVNENDAPDDTSDSGFTPPPADESLPETSEQEPTFDGITNIYAYEVNGYIDDGQRYLLLSRHLYRAEDAQYYDLIIYDEAENKVTGALDVEDESFPPFTYGNGVVTVLVDEWYLDEEENDAPSFIVYNEKFEPQREVYKSQLKGINSLKYLPDEKQWYFNDPEGFYKANDDLSEITKLADFDLYDYYVVGDEIIYYRIISEYSAPADDADIFGIMDTEGNVISETKAASYGCGEFRLKKAGDKLCFMSERRFDDYGLLRQPMKGIIFYDCKTREQKTFYPETDNENCFCDVTPNGKYLVTGILLKENYYTYLDHTIKLYDIESEKLLESETLGTNGASFLAMSVFNDKVLLSGGGSAVYEFKAR